MHKILITGGGGPAGVNVIKSLKEGEEPPFVVGTEVNHYHLEFTRPIADESILVPRCTDDRYVGVINGIIEKYGIELIHPQPDIEVQIISEKRDLLKAKTFLPPKDTVKKCQDKHASAKIWEKHGFPSVDSHQIRYDSLEEDIAEAFERFGPKLWLRASHGAGGIGSTPADNPDIALNWIRYWKARGKTWSFMAQEYLPGENIAFQSLWKDGELIVSQARERIEYIYPYLAPSGITGTPAVAKTVHNDHVNEMATKAVRAIDPKATGIFCVDIKFNKQGEAMPTEINVGRFFTTSYFFSHAGTVYNRPYANMPSLMLKLVFDEPLADNIPKYNALPKDLYWIRHIDCSHHLVPEKDLQKNLY